MAAILTSDQVNYLIWRYLQECGYTYSVYAFQHETKAETLHDIYGPKIKPGSLISLIQRGLQYRELEFQINKDDTMEDVEPYFPPLSTSANSMSTISAGNGHMEVDDEEDDERASIATATQQQAPSNANFRKHGRGEDGINGMSSGGEKSGVQEKKKRRKTAAQQMPVVSDRPGGIDGDKSMIDNVPVSPSPIEEVRAITNGCSIGIQVETVTEIVPSETIILPIPSNDQRLNTAAWSPVQPGKLVTGTQSSIARIWTTPEGQESPSHIMLDHTPTLVKRQEVTAVQWSSNGNIVAIGTFDGTMKLWTPTGEALGTFRLKPSPVLSMRWNKLSTILLSLDINGALLVWDPESGDMISSFEGKLEVLDVQWIGDDMFAAATSEGTISIHAAKTGDMLNNLQVGERVGIPALAWNDSGNRLASGDAKGRIAIWGDSQTTPEYVVQAHGCEISQLSWQPIRVLQSAEATLAETPTTRILASLSNKETAIKLWSFDTSPTNQSPLASVHDLSLHDSCVSKMAWSPDGKYIASGSYRKLYVWRVDDAFLAYVYDATTLYDTIKTEDGAVMNGEDADSKAVVVKHTNGDVRMGGMDDNDADGDTDSGKGGLDAFDISDISWDCKGTKVAVGMAGLGCVLVPIKPTRPNTKSALLPTVVGEMSCTVDTTASIATADATISEVLVANGTQQPEELANGGPSVR